MHTPLTLGTSTDAATAATGTGIAVLEYRTAAALPPPPTVTVHPTARATAGGATTPRAVRRATTLASMVLR